MVGWMAGCLAGWLVVCLAAILALWLQLQLVLALFEGLVHVRHVLLAGEYYS